MKAWVVSLFLGYTSLVAMAQTKPAVTKNSGHVQKEKVVEAACGQCKFGLKGHGCDLAIRLNGKAYFVEGSDIDSHGDAHAKDGFCNAIRQAKVQGEVVGGTFRATSFKLLPEAPKK